MPYFPLWRFGIFVSVLFTAAFSLVAAARKPSQAPQRTTSISNGEIQRNALAYTHVPDTSSIATTIINNQGTSSSTIKTQQLINHDTPRAPSSSPRKPWRLLRNPTIKPGERAVYLPVLMYHYIRPHTSDLTVAGKLLSVTPEHFAAQMQELKDRGYGTITPDALYAAVTGGAPLPPKPVLLTFDDGYRDQFINAFPILRRLGLRATFFVMSDYVTYAGYMTSDMLRELDRSGVATIASHTRHHALLSSANHAVRRDEVMGSKQKLEHLLGHPVTVFAYPYGAYTESIRLLVQSSGYRMAFSTHLGSLHTSSSLMELRRVRVLDGEKLSPLLQRFEGP